MAGDLLYCSSCGRGPNHTIIPISTSNNWFGKEEIDPEGNKNMIWHDRTGKSTGYLVGPRCYRKPTPKELSDGYAKGLERRQIRGKEIKLKPDTEYVRITELRRGPISRLLCESCRGRILQMAKNANRAHAEEETVPMFDNLADIDAAGKAKREEKKKARRDMNKPITDQYTGDVG